MPLIKTIREDIISDQEVLSTIRNADTDETRAFVCFLALTGARISEILNIQAKDIEVGEDFWTLSILTLKQRPKQWQIPPRRTLKFPRDILFEKIIKPYINNGHFSSITKLFPKSDTFYSYKLKQANPNVYPHLFRHTLASKFSERVDSYDLKEWFGWSSIIMSDKYVHRRQAIDKIFKTNKAYMESKKDNPF